jgi:hypothetical protein
MMQQARNLLIDLDDRGQRPRFLIQTVTQSSAALTMPSSTATGCG